MADTLPPHYFYFFWIGEPVLTLAGAAYAAFWPETYARDLLPQGIENFTNIVGNTIRGKELVGTLASCYFLIALISLSFFPVFKWQVKDMVLQERLVRALLVPLALADVTHITMSLLPLPAELRWSWTSWTQLIHGNVDIVVFALTLRLLCIFGIGRETAASLAAKDKPVSSRTRGGRPKKSISKDE